MATYGTRYAGNRANNRTRISRRVLIGVGAAAVAGASLITTKACAAGFSGIIDDLTGQSRQLMELGVQIVEALVSEDYSGAQNLAREFESVALSLQDSTSGALWNVAEVVPVYGQDVQAARQLVGVVCDLATNALIPFVDAVAANPPSALISSATDSAITFNLAVLQGLSDAVLGVVPALEDALTTIDDIEEVHVGQLQEIIEGVKAVSGPLRDGLDLIQPLLGVLPTMLGSQGHRTYLVVAQGNAEVRSTGGFPGAVGLVEVEAGTVSLGEFVGITTLMPWIQEAPLAITDEERLVFGDRVSYIPGDMNYIPDYARVSELWSQCCMQSSGVVIDGTIAVDPVFLQELLALVGGSISAWDGSTVDGTNAAQVLLHDVYWNYPNDSEAQNAYFFDVARQALNLITSGLTSADPLKLVEAVSTGAKKRRLNFWSAYGDEQAALESLGCAGMLGGNGDNPTTGIYFADETWGKVDWWLDATVKQGEVSSSADGTFECPITLTISNSISQEDAALGDGNAYLVGANGERRQSGDILTYLYLYAPVNGAIENLVASPGSLGGYVPVVNTATHEGLQVSYFLTKLLPGESAEITYTVRFQDADSENPELAIDVTPLCRDVSIMTE